MAKTISRESLGYAILLIILCAIASLAAWQTISFLSNKLLAADYNIATISIWSLTLGFMLIAGAFGLWATSFAAEAESRRRVSKLIETMDYILDGLIAIDAKGFITGANVAAHNLVSSDNINKQPLIDIFKCLSPDDIKLLTDKNNLNEIERSLFVDKSFQTLRFRSQPTKGLSLILISDVTFMQEQKDQRRQDAQLKLIGEIAKGVANDFDNLLCGIAANATILQKFSPNTPELQMSAKGITSAAEKGTLLARKLNDLSNSSSPVNSSRLPATYIQTAVDNLHTVLSDDWQIASSIEPLSPTSLTGSKLEQVILNLGIIVADLLGKPGTLFINASPIPDNSSQILKERCTSIITICASEDNNIPIQTTTITNEYENPGVILSVIRSLIMEVGGSLESVNIANRQYAFKVCLPHGQTIIKTATASNLPEQFAGHIINWPILLAASDTKYNHLETTLLSYKVKVSKATSIITLLAEIEKPDNSYTILIFDEQLAENETEAVLKTITKLRPSMGVLVLAEDPFRQQANISDNITFVNENSTPDKIIMKMIDIEKTAIG